MIRYSIFQEIFTASISPNGTVSVYLDMITAGKVKIIIKKKKDCKKKKLKVKKFSLKACAQGRLKANPSTPDCLS